MAPSHAYSDSSALQRFVVYPECLFERASACFSFMSAASWDRPSVTFNSLSVVTLRLVESASSGYFVSLGVATTMYTWHNSIVDRGLDLPVHPSVTFFRSSSYASGVSTGAYAFANSPGLSLGSLYDTTLTRHELSLCSLQLFFVSSAEHFFSLDSFIVSFFYRMLSSDSSSVSFFVSSDFE